MNMLSNEKRKQILHLLVEGTSLRATARICDVSRNTVSKLLADAGVACKEFQDKTLTGLRCKRLQIDEIWSFVYSKKKNTSKSKKITGEAGDAWTWVVMDPDTRLVPYWLTGSRRIDDCRLLIGEIRSRVENVSQISTDGLKAYSETIEEVFGNDVAFAQVVKEFNEKKRFTCVRKDVLIGNPEDKHISTSHVERQNLTMRTSIKRFTRKTNAFSKKLEFHEHAIALHYMYYNFCRIHKTLKVTPAMEAGIVDTVYDLDFILELVGR